jgi:hypothetical protein
MSLFAKILEKLGFKSAAPAKGAAAAPGAARATGTAAAAAARDKLDMPGKPPAPAPIPVVDVVSKLEGLAAKNPQKLNWKVSIVDLLKLLDLDSSPEARKELAAELHCPADKMGDSAAMNTWLHKAVLQKLAANGGNIPRELLD